MLDSWEQILSMHKVQSLSLLYILSIRIASTLVNFLEHGTAMLPQLLPFNSHLLNFFRRNLAECSKNQDLESFLRPFVSAVAILTLILSFMTGLLLSMPIKQLHKSKQHENLL